MLRFQLLAALVYGHLLFAPSTILAQSNYPDQIVNGGFEESTNGRATGWVMAKIIAETRIELVQENVLKGERAVQIDTLQTASSGERMKANVSQVVSGKNWQGKRVRLRAAVKTSDLKSNARAQLWFRVDRKSESGRPTFGAFDNMSDRPIKGNEWQHYDIILQVDDDADKIVLGMFVIGKGKFWLDDISLETVDDQTPTTGRSLGSTSSKPGKQSTDKSKGPSAKEKKSQSRTTGFQMSPALQKAFAEAETAPQQPFFTHWMWLALIAIALFGLSGLPARPLEDAPPNQLVEKRVLGTLPKFALRFSVAYWLLYSLPTPFNRLTSQLGPSISVWCQKIYTWYSQQINSLVNWVAQTLFRINGELVPPNGSGDTTFNYIQVFTIFVLALIIAALWTAIDWRKTDYRNIKDLLRSYLRYVLAVTMLGYGLAKLGWDSNQFPTLTSHRLDRTWGETSPMGVLWNFMGASRPYTLFAGLGEVVGGVLLLFRRTTLVGSFVVLGVMVNVMMLNYCYDVPVKLYSTHLVCMAIYIMLPDMGRLTNLFLFHRATEPQPIEPPYTNGKTIWIQRVLKVALIVLLFGFPIYQHIKRQVDYFADQANQPSYLGSYDVVEFQLNDKVIEASDNSTDVWKTVRFERRAYNRQMQRVRSNWVTIELNQGLVSTNFAESGNGLTLEEHFSPAVPKERIDLIQLDDDSMILAGKIPAGDVKVKLQRQSQTYRLTNRGFRWINEVPFNR